MKKISVASFWDEDDAWFWVNEEVNNHDLNNCWSIDVQVTRLENGSYRASVSTTQAQGELFE